MNNRLRDVILLAAIFFTCACTSSHRGAANNQPYSEKYRPQYHFSPPKNWMNDPNGLVYYEGEYHLFYQHYPDGNVWGPMHWGHTISKDLVHWQNQPIALYPDSLGYIFSGSAVVDWHNTSGLGSNNNPPIVAIYTYHNMQGEKSGKTDYQNQGIAYSLNKGRTWTKYHANPVLRNQGIKDFRDPKVIWHAESKSWIMALAVKDKVSFYTSPNLIDWRHSSDFNASWAAYGDVWECPDLFPLTTRDGITKWALLVSINPGGPNGGSATQYFVGDFDGIKFTTRQSQIKWLDYGADNYAGVTWSDVPHATDHRLFVGWMSNWSYAQNVPTEYWRSAMTIPRVLTLENGEAGYTLLSNPANELKQLRQKSTVFAGKEITLPSDLLEIEVELLPDNFQITLSNDKKEKVILKRENDQLIFDRSQSGLTAFSPAFATIHTTPLHNLVLKTLRLYIDRSSVECIFNNGELNLTELVFPSSPYTLLELQGTDKPVTVHQLKSIWTNPEHANQ